MSRCNVSAKDIRIRRVLSRIEETPQASIQDLARLVKLSSSRLGHLFKAETGMELRHFLLEAKLQKAAKLLRNTDMQIKEISHTIGYHHVPSFDRIFRKKFELSPADYRRQELETISEPREAVLFERTNHTEHEDSEKC